MKTIFTLILCLASAGHAQDAAAPPPAAAGPVIVRFNSDQQSAFQSILLQQDNLRLRTCLSNQIPEDECGQLTMQGVMRMPKVQPGKPITTSGDIKPAEKEDPKKKTASAKK